MNAASTFVGAIRRHDGVDAFNEASRIALADEQPARVHLRVEDGVEVVALAFAVGDAPVELAVHPAHRRRGHGSALYTRVRQLGESRFWAHGDLPVAHTWADRLELVRERTLLRLARTGGLPFPDVPLSSGTVIREFRAGDLPGLLDVNARAFATHPEQGRMDRADFERRTQSGWFDPRGLLVAEQSGKVVGFHWTKVVDGWGEVYVLAVDPRRHREGLGAALLVQGLAHLETRGVDGVELYVDGGNRRALNVYATAGFTEAGRDVLYVSTSQEAAGHVPS